ncbi:unnamed protein product [Nippostrongylus brasiliensis]|uniref:Secreted protein n=1 Tax=Nippostrongylus brasiliensis TaxID=27835 RepID=A0A0N4XE93_NIPBR|nr:unnamed protein product [Nippostrongylus brasiliensis]
MSFILSLFSLFSFCMVSYRVVPISDRVERRGAVGAVSNRTTATLIDDVLVMLPRWRARRSQPIIDYTDEFSADPFEVPDSVCMTCRREAPTYYYL